MVGGFEGVAVVEDEFASGDEGVDGGKVAGSVGDVGIIAADDCGTTAKANNPILILIPKLFCLPKFTLKSLSLQNHEKKLHTSDDCGRIDDRLPGFFM